MGQSAVDSAPQAASARILVVEDEPLIRFTVAEALRELGVCVVEAATGDEAWKFLSSGEAVDLVFTDHRMPGTILGAELAARIRKDYPEVPVVLTSAYVEKGAWTGSFLPKPYNLFDTAADLAKRAFGKRKREADQ